MLSVCQIRLGEAESLDSLQQWFEERATTLKRLAYYQERRLRRLGLIDDGRSRDNVEFIHFSAWKISELQLLITSVKWADFWVKTTLIRFVFSSTATNFISITVFKM